MPPPGGLTSEQTEQWSLGEKVARTLLLELNFARLLRASPKDDDLQQEPPRREALNFQEEGGQPAAKQDQLVEMLFEGVKRILATCIVSGTAGEPEEFALDHVFPVELYREKQVALLEHLNKEENKCFAGGFLETTINHDGKTLDIKGYFGTTSDEPNAKIQARWRFYRACYNDVDNLLVMGLALNSKKGSQPPKEWLEQHLGPDFSAALAAKGGIQEGIILQKVCEATEAETVKIKGTPCVLHNGEGVGLAQFIKEWCDEKDEKYPQSLVKLKVSVFEECTEMVRRRLTGNLDESHRAKKATDRVIPIMREAIKAVKKHYGLTASGTSDRMAASARSAGASSSGSDNDETIAPTVEQMRRAMDTLQKFFSAQKRLIKFIQNHRNANANAALNAEVKASMETFLPTVPSDDFEELSGMLARLESKGNSSSHPEVIELAIKLMKEYKPPVERAKAEVQAQAKARIDEFQAQAAQDRARIDEFQAQAAQDRARIDEFQAQAAQDRARIDELEAKMAEMAEAMEQLSLDKSTGPTPQVAAAGPSPSRVDPLALSREVSTSYREAVGTKRQDRSSGPDAESDRPTTRGRPT